MQTTARIRIFLSSLKYETQKSNVSNMSYMFDCDYFVPLTKLMRKSVTLLSRLLSDVEHAALVLSSRVT